MSRSNSRTNKGWLVRYNSELLSFFRKKSDVDKGFSAADGHLYNAIAPKKLKPGECKPVEIELLGKPEIPENIENLYGKDYIIEKRPGTEVFLPTLKDNQAVCYGDGKTFYYLLTKKEE
jgi:hypothetical protein